MHILGILPLVDILQVCMNHESVIFVDLLAKENSFTIPEPLLKLKVRPITVSM